MNNHPQKSKAFFIASLCGLFAWTASQSQEFGIGWNGYPIVAYKSKRSTTFELRLGGTISNHETSSYINDNPKKGQYDVVDVHTIDEYQQYNAKIGVAAGSPIITWKTFSLSPFVAGDFFYSWTESISSQSPDESWEETYRYIGLVGLKPQVQFFERKISLEYELGLQASYQKNSRNSYIDSEATTRRNARNSSTLNYAFFGKQISWNMGLAVFYWI